MVRYSDGEGTGSLCQTRREPVVPPQRVHEVGNLLLPLWNFRAGEVPPHLWTIGDTLLLPWFWSKEHHSEGLSFYPGRTFVVFKLIVYKNFSPREFWNFLRSMSPIQMIVLMHLLQSFTRRWLAPSATSWTQHTQSSVQNSWWLRSWLLSTSGWWNLNINLLSGNILKVSLFNAESNPLSKMFIFREGDWTNNVKI